MILGIYSHRGLEINKKKVQQKSIPSFTIIYQRFWYFLYNLAQMCTNYNLDLYSASIVHIKQSFLTIFFFQICQSQNVNIASFKGQLIQKFGHFTIFFCQNFEILISCLLAAQQAKILKKSAIQGNHTHFTIKKARIMEPIALIFFIQPTVSWILLKCHLFFQEIYITIFYTIMQ